jgi:SAM-dependent methyltransferase
MKNKLSGRLADIVNALPLFDGIRILEIGCGPGAAAREIATRIGDGYVLAIDRSAKAIGQAIAGSQAEIESGRLSFRQVAVEDFELKDGEAPFDVAFAVRVGALDGRHPEMEVQALSKIAKALTGKGKLFIDGGNPLKEIRLENYISESQRSDDTPSRSGTGSAS